MAWVVKNFQEMSSRFSEFSTFSKVFENPGHIKFTSSNFSLVVQYDNYCLELALTVLILQTQLLLPPKRLFITSKNA